MLNRILTLFGLLALILSTVSPASVYTRSVASPIGMAQFPGNKEPLPVIGKEDGPFAAKPSNAAKNRHVKVPHVIGETDPGGSTPAIYIVRLADAALANYAGNVAGFSATSPQVTGRHRLDGAAADSVRYLAYLSGQQARQRTAIEQSLGRAVTVKFTYTHAFNGMALLLTPQEAVAVAKLEGVVSVQRDEMLQLHTDAGPTWIGAPGLWNGNNTGGLPGSKGEGVVVAILDTGINMGSPSFAALGGDGYSHTNPKGKFFGVCDPNSLVYDTRFTCNNKLIGAWDFVDEVSAEIDGPEDAHGHGSHTASTAAGNFVIPATLLAPTFIYSTTISGVAPHANIIAYDVCEDGCPTSASVAAIDQTIKDGVDVINFSIGGGSRDPWLDATAQAFLGAFNAGIVTVTSAGNSGPNVATLGSPGDAPWMLTIGASTHPRKFVNRLINMSGGNTTPPATLTGQSITAGYGPAALVYAANVPNPNDANGNPALCAAPYPAGTFNGQIVICDRGVVGRIEKGENVKAGGAGGMVLINDAPNAASLSGDPHVLPAVHISYADGQILKPWLASGSGHMATIEGTTTTISAANADIMAAFSSRGPSASMPSVVKPDLTGPGVDILAAYRRPEGIGLLSGTSMSSPHVAGAAALLAALHPTWTPAQVRSALMSTAQTVGVRKEDGTTPADPFDRGAGRVDLTCAARAGFVLNETALRYETANPLYGGDPTALNLASLGNASCVGICTWTRTLSSTQSASVQWTVSVTNPITGTLSVQPMNFTLQPNATQVVTITADLTALATGNWAFGQVTFAPNTGAIPEAHFPVAAYRVAGSVPAGEAELVVETRRNAGVEVLEGVRAVATNALTATVFAGQTFTSSHQIAQDPTNNDPFDLAEGGVYTQNIVVGSTVKRLGLTITSSTAPDLDLFVGRDANNNGRADSSELICSSTTISWDEECVLPGSGTTLLPGTYWILVQNWQGSGQPLDSFTLQVTRVADAQSPAMRIVAPSSVSQGMPFDLQFVWDFPDLKPGESRIGVIEVGTAAGTPSDIASIPVTIYRLDDDVSIGSGVTPDEFVKPGDVLTYTVHVQPETVDTNPVTYRITSTIPASMTYVAGSATDSPTVNGNQLVWQLPVEQTRRYVMTNNQSDPQCDTGFDGYIDLFDFGLLTNPQISGDGFTYKVDQFYGLNSPYNFFGVDYPQLYFTDDGLAFPGLSYATYPGVNSGNNVAIPNPAAPNNLIAPFWKDLQIVYDEATNKGVTVAGAEGGSLMLVEYDDVVVKDSPGTSLDFEIGMARQVSDFSQQYEIVFAYNNITGTLASATVGIENADGSTGLAYTGPITNGLVVCYDWKSPEKTITYQVRVNNDVTLDTTLQTDIVHSLNAPKTKQATGNDGGVFVSSTDLSIVAESPVAVDSGPITYTLTVANQGPGTATDLVVESKVPPGTTYLSGGMSDGKVISWTLASLASGASTQVHFSVLPRGKVDVYPGLAQSASEVVPSSTTIVGGQEAVPGAWPWQVALFVNLPGVYQGQFCGGSLLTEEIVVTASHCVDGLSIAPLSVVVGRHALSSNEGQQVAVSEIIINSAYDPFTLDNDIALLRLATPVTLTEKVKLVNLIGADQLSLAAVGVAATATGWGDLQEGAGLGSDTLQQVTVPIVDNATCNFVYQSYAGSSDEFVTANMICAGLPQGGKDTCQGDSGGPLVVRDGNNGWLQVGITSWGLGCARPGFPGIYARVSHFLPWIDRAGNTYTLYEYSVKDGTGKPGHRATGQQPASTIQGLPFTLTLPFVAR